MQWTVLAITSIAVLTGLRPPDVVAGDVPAANKSEQRPAPPKASRPPREGGPAGRGYLGGIIANDGEKSASFFFGDDPPDLHYTYFSTPFDREIYDLFHEKLELIGSDGTGNYWHYRTLRPPIPPDGWQLPKEWYVPKDWLKHPAVWFQTQEPGAKIEYYGRAVGYMSCRWASEKGRKETPH